MCNAGSVITKKSPTNAWYLEVKRGDNPERQRAEDLEMHVCLGGLLNLQRFKPHAIKASRLHEEATSLRF